MRRSFVAVGVALGAAGLLGTLAAGEARGCAPAPPPGMIVRIRDESALIAWDPARKLEHFVRYARFETSGQAKDFGFLVPTPSRPELAEASHGTFGALEEAILPEKVYETRTRIQPTALCLAPFLLMRGDAGARAVPAGAVTESVQVLDEVRVAGYEAAVLAANDAGALADWLKTHGYDERPALTDWLKRYVEAGWIITAFKVVGDATAPVRLTFETERPFYPYREPEDARRDGDARPRSLRVFFVGPERVDGTLGDAGDWPGAVEWASTVPTERVKRLVHASLPDGGLPPGDALWLTAFEDASSPRPGTDEVYFARAADQSRQVPPPIVIVRHDDVPLPLDVILAVGVVPTVIMLRRRRRARATGKGA